VPDRHCSGDVVFLYAPPWTGPTRFSKHHLASYLAATGRRVLYIEAPLTPIAARQGATFLRELSRTRRPPARVNGKLWVRRHFLPLPYHAATRLTSTRAANRLGQRWLAPLIRRDLAWLGFSRPILIAGLPHAVDSLPLLPRRGLVYHCADDYAHVRGFPRSLPELEADLCRHADLVITTSATLCDDRRQFNPNTHWVPNGVDVEHFSSPADPALELIRLPRPVIGFVGGLSQWVDVHLLASVAALRPAYTFVLIGPIGTDVRPLRGRPNVLLLGPRRYADVPRYLAAMDAALIPFTRDLVTFHADPIKTYEYLAAGLPVVATDLPALRRLTPLVFLAGDADAFAFQIDTALAESANPERRRERQAEAARHSWQSRFAGIDELMCQTLPCGS
jgi:glycosyltransferase involved in cell wall biosynthesis